jgi:hypothetical protein
MGKARERPATDYRAMLARAYYGHWTAAGDPRHRRPARYLCGARQLRGAGADTPGQASRIVSGFSGLVICQPLARRNRP